MRPRRLGHALSPAKHDLRAVHAAVGCRELFPMTNDELEKTGVGSVASIDTPVSMYRGYKANYTCGLL